MTEILLIVALNASTLTTPKTTILSYKNEIVNLVNSSHDYCPQGNELVD